MNTYRWRSRRRTFTTIDSGAVCGQVVVLIMCVCCAVMCCPVVVVRVSVVMVNLWTDSTSVHKTGQRVEVGEDDDRMHQLRERPAGFL